MLPSGIEVDFIVGDIRTAGSRIPGEFTLHWSGWLSLPIVGPGYLQSSMGNGGVLPRSGENAKRQLISAGEKLFARNGIDATTIAAITKEAGQRNNYAVGWHFGGKEELLQAILDKHQSKIDDTRLALLAKYEGTDLVPLEDLALALVQPLADRLRDSSGGADYLRIQAQLAHYNISYVPRDRPPGLAKLLRLCEPHWEGFGRGSTDEALLMLVVVFHGLSGFATLHPKPTPAELDNFTDLLVKNVVAMMEIVSEQARSTPGTQRTMDLPMGATRS